MKPFLCPVSALVALAFALSLAAADPALARGHGGGGGGGGGHGGVGGPGGSAPPGGGERVPASGLVKWEAPAGAAVQAGEVPEDARRHGPGTHRGGKVVPAGVV